MVTALATLTRPDEALEVALEPALADLDDLQRQADAVGRRLGGRVPRRHPLASVGRQLDVDAPGAGRRHERGGRERRVSDAQLQLSSAASWRSSASSPTSRTSSGRSSSAAARSAAARVAGVGCWASQSTRV